MSVASLGFVKNGFDNPLCSITPQEVAAGGNVYASEQLRVQQGFPTQDGVVNPTAITFYDFYTASVAGGGLNPHSLQLYGYYDPRVSGPLNTIQQHLEVKIVPTAAPVAGVPPSTTGVFATNQSRPFNWAAPFVGTITGTGLAQVVPCAGIPANSIIRFVLVGTSAGAYAPIAAPSAISVQPYTSFTCTLTLDAIYNYEVLFG